MYIKKIIISLVLASLSCIVLAEDNGYINSFNPGKEPDGFRNIQWGTPIFNLEDEIFKPVDTSGNEKIYIKENEDYLLGRTKVDRIEYCFWDDLFYKVKIYVTGLTERSSMLIYVFDNFGRGKKAKGCYRYKGSKTGLMFCGQPGQDLSILTLYSFFQFSPKD